MQEAVDPVAGNENILRRVSLNVWMPNSDEFPLWKIFRPSSGDSDGLSVSRERYTAAQVLSVRSDGKKYHIAMVKASVILSNDMTIKPDPTIEDVGHSLIPEINIDEYKGAYKKKMREKMFVLAENCKIILIQQ